MADIKISQLPAATTPLAGTEEVPLVQSGTTKKTTVVDLLNPTATTLDIGGAATTLNIGAATGTMTVGNTTLAAKAITASTTLGVTGVSTLTGGAVVQGLTVGLGAGALDNTVFGVSALAANSTGIGNIAIGNSVLAFNSTGNNNTGAGNTALVNVTGSNNTGFGKAALQSASGDNNVAIGSEAGYAITTGSNNVIFGGYSGGAAPISATGSNWIVLSDGAGNVRQAMDATSVQSLTGAAVVYSPAPAATISAVATLTNAQILPQIVVTSGTTFTLTMPTGSTLETLVSWAGTDLGFDFSVINTASGTITMAANTNVTIVGRLTVLTAVSARFRICRTAASTFVLYRLS